MITSSIIFVVRLSDMLFAFSLKSCCYETGLSNEYCRLQGRSAEMCRSLGHVVADTPVDALTHARVHGRTTRGQELTTDHRMVFEPERPGTDWGREGMCVCVCVCVCVYTHTNTHTHVCRYINICI